MNLLMNKCFRNNLWTEVVGTFLVATQFTKNKYIEAGFDGNLIKVKPNFIFPGFISKATTL